MALLTVALCLRDYMSVFARNQAGETEAVRKPFSSRKDYPKFN